MCSRVCSRSSAFTSCRDTTSWLALILRGITKKIIAIPAKRLGFPQIRSVPGKDAAPKKSLLDGDMLHRGCRACPRTGTCLHRGYRACPSDRDRPPAWVYDLSLGQGKGLFLPFPVPVGQVWYRHRACTMCLYQTCPSGTGTLPVPNLSNWDRHSACPTLLKSALDQV